jgi:hypothetical protein
MTTLTPITPHSRNEGLTAALTPVGAAFLELLHMLEAGIAAERGVLRSDTNAFDAAQKAAEVADKKLGAQCAALLAMPDLCAADRSLRKMAFLLNSVLSMEHDTDRRFHAALTLRHARIFEAWGAAPTTRTVRDLQRRCLARIAVLMRLRDIGHDHAEAAGCTPGLGA